VQNHQREGFRVFLKERGIGSLIHYPVPVHRQPAYLGRLPLPGGPLAVTEAACERILSLPIHAQLSAAQLDRVIAAVKEWTAAHP
jgi:dTDP-4-amino-4,6-dideoxygalactose transaminase